MHCCKRPNIIGSCALQLHLPKGSTDASIAAAIATKSTLLASHDCCSGFLCVSRHAAKHVSSQPIVLQVLCLYLDASVQQVKVSPLFVHQLRPISFSTAAINKALYARIYAMSNAVNGMAKHLHMVLNLLYAVEQRNHVLGSLVSLAIPYTNSSQIASPPSSSRSSMKACPGTLPHHHVCIVGMLCQCLFHKCCRRNPRCDENHDVHVEKEGQ